MLQPLGTQLCGQYPSHATLHQVTRQVVIQARHLRPLRPPAPPAPNHLKGPHLLAGDIKPLCWALLCNGYGSKP